MGISFYFVFSFSFDVCLYLVNIGWMNRLLDA